MSADQQVTARSRMFTITFFAILFFLLYQAGVILASFISALLWAAIIALALSPVHRRVLTVLGGRETLAASVMTGLVLLLIIGPTIAVLFALVSQSVDLYHWASDMVRTGGIAEAWERFLRTPLGRLLEQLPRHGVDLKTTALTSIGDLSSGIASQFGDMLKNTMLLILNLLIMLISIFFFFRDGESYYRSLIGLLPFTDTQKEAITKKFHDTFTAVLNGVFLIAIMQGVLTGVGFALFDVAFPVFWGFAAALMALFPIGGAAAVWVGGSAYLFLTHQTLYGILLAVWGALLVSLPDNFLRPLIIGRKAKIPTFLLFLGILGGIRAYGFLGILFGPVVVTLLLAFVSIYREEFAGKH